MLFCGYLVAAASGLAPGCPIHRALCDGWDHKCPTSHNIIAFALALLPQLMLPLLCFSGLAQGFSPAENQSKVLGL
jgi:hypothetical protein